MIKKNWHKIIFPMIFLLFVYGMVSEYIRGNCRINVDMGIFCTSKGIDNE